MRLLWLADVLRAAGLTVHEVNGWKTRGSSTFEPRGLICHATAGSSTSTDAGEIRVLLQGSTTAPPPIAQLYLSRTGHWHVVASGRCNHALTGWGGPLRGYGNPNLIGVEAQNDNRGQPWPQAQRDSYVRGVAAICRRMGWADPGRHVAAHREHQPYPPPSWTRSSKSDPHGIDMGTFRARVAALLSGDEDDMTPQDLLETKIASSATGVTATVGDLLKQGLELKMIGLPAVQRDVAELRYAVAGLSEVLRTVLDSGGSVDTAAVLQRIDQRASEDAGRDAQHAQALASLAERAERAETEAAVLRQRLAEALQQG